MASSTIESSAKYLGNLLVEEVKYLAKVKNQVEELQSELEWMQCFLLEVDIKQNKNALLRKWVSEIKDLALDAEDLIQTYILKVSRKRLDKGLLDDLKWLACCCRDASTLHNVASEIDALSARISKMSSRLERYGVKSSYERYLAHVDVDTKMLVERRRTYSHDEDKDIVGREECVKEVVNVLQGDQHKIVLVHGMGGIGKTTLARKVYNNDTLKRQFDGFAWAYVSQQLQLEPVCREILLQLIPENDKSEKDRVKQLPNSQLAGELSEKLKQKKYLIVLDDVWSKKDWEHLRNALSLSDTCHGSKLVITTRDGQILSNLPHNLVYDYELKLLDSEKSWQLFQKAADFDKNAGLPSTLNIYHAPPKGLIVLDDVWSKKDWEHLRNALSLSDTCHGSKLLMTTRDGQILSSLDHNLVCDYELKLLDSEKSWQLFQKAADFDRKADSKLEEIGQKMLDHCNGHPLAIVVLGGVLATKNKTEEEWRSVYDNLPSHLQGDDSYTGVYQVLAMSYYELPYHLKPCFLLLGHFPEDFDIEVEKLYHLWIAEGIVSSTLDKVTKKRIGQSLEEICEVYLNDLVQKGMVQVGSRDDLYGNIKTCRLHDLMRDKCLEINEEENFLQIFDYHALKNDPQRRLNEPDEKLRRMTIYCDDKVPKLASGNSPRTSLRSILFFALEHTKEHQDCRSMIVGLCKNFQLLRVLDFEGLKNLTGSLPREVGSLIFLRYLSLKDTGIGEVPSSIGNLRSLMILDLRGVHYLIRAMKIPNVVWMMKSLTHMYLPWQYNYEIKKGKKLKLEQLSHLEKLENVDLDRVEGLGELGSMRKLRLRGGCKSNKKSLEPILKSKSIKWLGLEIHPRILEEDPMVLSTCDSLKVLHITDNDELSFTPSLPLLPMIPEMFPQSLTTLDIYGCNVVKDPMPILETLSKLKSLSLDTCDDVNKMVCSEKGFPELTHFIIKVLSSLMNWTVEKGGLPKLQQVRIYDCPIRKLPDVLPPNVSIECHPCVRGIERYGTCSNFKKGGPLVQDEDEDEDSYEDDENSVIEGEIKD